jgi:hypothetical protein
MDLNPSNVAAASHAGADRPPEYLAAFDRLLVSLSSRSPESLAATLNNLNLAFPSPGDGHGVLVATPDFSAGIPTGVTYPNLRLVPSTAAAASITNLFLTAADFLNAFTMMQEPKASACLVLGADADALSPAFIRSLANTVLDDTIDLAVPYYQIGPHQGLVNSAILYPVTRTLFGTLPRFPLAIDLGLSYRMAERLANSVQRFSSAGANETILWPVAENAVANFAMTEVETGPYSLVQPPPADLNALLTQILGSLFSDVEAKASYWQRVRPNRPARAVPAAPSPSEGWPDVTPMLEAFRMAYTNLAEIWALVLPPNSLLGLKHLSLMPPARFHLADALWVRIVYDFMLAYRQRTINRGHLLGALTPLYLAWVASHIILANGGTLPEQHIQELVATFENDKAYLVSRWRWPDRFNP